MSYRMQASGVVAIVLWATAAGAWPVDAELDLILAGDVIRPLAGLQWAESDDEAVVAVEVLPTQELLFSPRGVGTAVVLVYGEGKIAAWRVRVSPAGGKAPARPGEDLAAARRACPKLSLTGKGPEAALEVFVPDDACRLVLRRFLTGEGLLARQVSVTFGVDGLQAQLRDIQAGFAAAKLPKLSAKYVGAGLWLEGALDPAEHRRALWEIFRRSVGRVALEDRVSVTAR